MFGIEKRVKRVRDAIVAALNAKTIEIMSKYANERPENIPRQDLARAMVLRDIAEILTNVSVAKHPDDEEEA